MEWDTAAGQALVELMNGEVKKLGAFPIAVSIIDISSFMLNKYIDLFSISIKVFLSAISSGFNDKSFLDDDPSLRLRKQKIKKEKTIYRYGSYTTVWR